MSTTNIASNGVSFFLAIWTSNKYGRKPGLYVDCVSLISGTALQTVAHNLATFIAARALLGAAARWYTSGTPLLINENEIAYPAHKAIASACFQCVFYLCSIVSAWVTFATRNYDSSFFMAPLSPRSLASIDRIEAADVIAKRHANINVSLLLVHFETEEINNTMNAEQEGHASTSYADVLMNKGNRWRLLISTVGITSVTHQTLIFACLQVWNLIWGQQVLQ
ncbi:hypothetical protein KAF25_010469 [Fusarium avenaceum]|uniref:Uncharacterized protein n=1 Tax=Fusarium avenaceum TaxID=40199 RepID=A0A9P7GYW4_9HYPO|nr:hypothetical protein KAF25_010469 [Fusarium avenaceum]